jgi:hypothetical protein
MLSYNTQQKLKNNFKNFLYLLWKYLNLPEPTPRQYEVADFLQDFSNKRRIIEAYRGFGKSWITSAYVLWRLYSDPNQRFLVISASSDRSKQFTAFTQRLIITIPFLQHLIPPASMRWGKEIFDVNGSLPAHAPNVKASGVFGQLTGSRATEIIVDDAEVKNNVETETMRAKLYATLTELENIVVPGGIITYLGTPHSMDSIYGKHKLLARGYTAYIIPARYPKLEEIHHYHGFLSPKIVSELKKKPDLQWKPTDTRFDDEELNLRELSGGHSNFMMQYMLDTTETDEMKYPLKLRDLIVFETDKLKAPVSIKWSDEMDTKLDYTELGVTGEDSLHKPSRVDKEWKHYNGVYMAIDPSGRGTDQTAYAIVAESYTNLYILDLGGLDGGYSEDILNKLAQKAKEYNVTKIIIESNYGDGMFQQLFKPILFRYVKVPLEEVKHVTKKEERIIDTLEPVLNQHRLIMDTDIIKREYTEYFREDRHTYSLLYQLTHITRDKDSIVHDDKLDALAIAVAAWQKNLGLDAETLKEKEKERELKELLYARSKRRQMFYNKMDNQKTKDTRQRLKSKRR